MMTDSTHAARRTPAKGPAETVKISSKDLMSGQDRIVITHAQDEYTLRVTRNGKLILTK